jgi:RNA polymerase-binding transcription factor
MALSHKESEELRGLIENRRQALVDEIREDVARARDEQFGDIAGPAPDAGDESVAELISDLGRAGLSRDLGELRGLDAARERMASDRYGVCVDCGAEISFARLRAEPAALRCVDCQRLHEKTFAGAGCPTL